MEDYNVFAIEGLQVIKRSLLIQDKFGNYATNLILKQQDIYLIRATTFTHFHPQIAHMTR